VRRLGFAWRYRIKEAVRIASTAITVDISLSALTDDQEEEDMAKETPAEGQGMTEKKPTTVQEAGRKGGRRVKEKYGQAFYVDIGKKGGRIIAETRGSDYYAQIGKKGGETVRQRHGSEFFAQIGKKGGDEVKRRHGPDYYSQIGKKGGEAPRRTDRRRSATSTPTETAE